MAKNEKNFTTLWYEKSLLELAADLHDGIGHRLVSILWDLEGFKREVAEKDAIEKLDDIGNNLRETVNDLQQIVYGIRPALLDQVGLVEAIRLWVEAQLRAKRILFNFSTECETLDLPRFVADQVFRIVQEGIHNIIQHAHASLVVLQINRDNENVLITLIDNGRGYEPGLIAPGLGLKTMQERALMIQGELQILPYTGGGTMLKLTLPNKGEDTK